jgi:hypothetical protein
MNARELTMTEPSDADLNAVDPSMLVKIAAAVLGISGLLVVLVGLQLIGLRFYFYPWLGYVKFGFMAAGAAIVALALPVFRARTWAPPVAGALAALTSMTLFGWLVYLFTDVFSCLTLVSVPITGIASLLTLASIPAVSKTAAARRRLAQHGMNLGL